MSFKDRLLADVKYTILNLDEFGENVSYTPFGNSPKLIKAIVRRDRLDSPGQDQSRLLAKQCEVWIANDNEAGILAVTKGEDLISMPVYEEAGSAVDWRVIEVLHKDHGLWHLLVQR